MKEVTYHLSIKLTEKPYALTFCPITGMDILKYNKEETKHPEQDTLDEIIREINRIITAHNKINHAITPWVSADIHYNKKGGCKKTRYYKLADDGLHLSDEIKEKWAAILYANIVRMCEDQPQ